MQHTKLKQRLSLSLDIAHSSVSIRWHMPVVAVCHRSMEPYEQAMTLHHRDHR